MRQIQLTIFLILLAVIANCQQFDFDQLKFKTLGFSTPKETIITLFGQPRIVDTNYECGFYINDQPGGPYYQLVYKDFNFIGSDKEEFILEYVHFDINGKIKVQYGNWEFDGLLTKSDFITIFGEATKKYFEDNPGDSILLYSMKSDDGVVFTFKNDRLISYKYWSPC